MAKVVSDFESKHIKTNSNVKKLSKKHNQFKRYRDLNFEFSAILLLILETIWSFKMP